MQRSNLDRGDNHPLAGSLLNEARSILTGYGAAEWTGNIKDRRVYAYNMRHFSGLRFVLVAKKGAPWLDNGVAKVSTQKALILIAADEGQPILMAVFIKGPKPVWRLFNSVEIHDSCIDEDRSHENTRFGSVMVNFEWDLGAAIKNPADLPDVWAEMKAQWEQRKDRKPTQIKIEAWHVKEPEPGMRMCEICGAVYSDELGACPGCPQEATA